MLLQHCVRTSVLLQIPLLEGHRLFCVGCWRTSRLTTGRIAASSPTVGPLWKQVNQFMIPTSPVALLSERLAFQGIIVDLQIAAGGTASSLV